MRSLWNSQRFLTKIHNFGLLKTLFFSQFRSHILQTPPQVPLFLRSLRPATTLWARLSSSWSPFLDSHHILAAFWHRPPPKRDSWRLIGAERTRRNPKRGPEGSKKGVPMSQIGSIWHECRQKVGVWVQNRAKNNCHASNVLVIGGRPKAAQEHWFGGRPKAAFIELF